MKEIRITPSILNADFSRLDEEIQKISSVSDLLHLDVMDNIFVPNFTFDFEAASKIITSSPLGVDAHLMVANVDDIAVKYAEIGCASVTIHAEATKNIPQTLRNIRKAGSRSSLGIKPNTDIDQYQSFVDDVDMFLIMTVEPGFGGQKFMHTMMDKVRRTKQIIGDRPIWLQVDGGVSMDTIAIALEAGADTFVVGSAVFKAPDPAEMVVSIREFANQLSK
ncbi:MAG: ribulose-phosphate 3-epimerase [Acidobacteriota bacterium]|jgi:ribulose-phosphate 3-epimerase|nr:ribulose-phosphate 3-epimerase [Acidobacteriota bacterium]